MQSLTTSEPTFSSPADLCLAPTPNLAEFWSLETIGITDDPTGTPSDTIHEDFKRTICHVNGRYEVRWPWRDNSGELPDNFHYCVQNIWATYGPHMGSPYAAHMQPICGPYVECFQKQPNCMWPICCLTYGNIMAKNKSTYRPSFNIWETHMGRCGHSRIESEHF